MPLDIPLWKTNTGQKKLFFFEPKILPKINPRGCSRIPTHSHLVRKTNTQENITPASSKEVLEIPCKYRV